MRRLHFIFVLFTTFSLTGCWESLLAEPGPTNPRMAFFKPDEGIVAVHSPPANIPGFPVSGWNVFQWHKEPDALLDHVVHLNAPSTFDPLFNKTARWAYATSGDKSHLWIYEHDGSRIFEIEGANGPVRPEGGTNVFLVTHTKPNVDRRLNRPVKYQLRGRIKWSRFRKKPHVPRKRKKAVHWDAFSLFSLTYKAGTPQATGLMLHIHHASSHPKRLTAEPWVVADFPGATRANYGALLPGDPAFATGGPLRDYVFDLNKYVCDAVVRFGTHFPPDARNLKHWQVHAITVGVETSNYNWPKAHLPGGDAAVAMQVSDINIVRDTKARWSTPRCPTTL